MNPSLPALLPLNPGSLLGPLEAWLAGLVFSMALLASAHALIYKRDSRSATLWFCLIWILPAAGTLLYLFFGINRVRRRAARLRRAMNRHRARRHPPAAAAVAGGVTEHMIPLVRLVDKVTPRPLVAGNRVEMLGGGHAAYPPMLAAIGTARTSVALASYIFDGTGIGAEFIAALAAAHRRGVAVRVLIDDFDARFSRLTATSALRRAGVPVGVFNPPFVPARINAIHLRSHRKILVVDGAAGFTGGLNIDERYWRPKHPEAAFRDLHFRLTGPVVCQLAEVFADDWQFATGEALRGHGWFPDLPPAGPTFARGIEAGPDENVERLRWVIIGALNAARRTIRIVTPYFIPDATLISALNAAALRGVEVDIILPQHSDLPHVQWAVMGQLWQVLERGCRVWLSPGPFDHSKLVVIDAAWTLLGSANWDARSLRLNFEFNVECHCDDLGARLEAHAVALRARAHRLSLAHLNGRSLPLKLRDGLARLFAPYL